MIIMYANRGELQLSRKAPVPRNGSCWGQMAGLVIQGKKKKRTKREKEEPGLRTCVLGQTPFSARPIPLGAAVVECPQSRLTDIIGSSPLLHCTPWSGFCPSPLLLELSILVLRAGIRKKMDFT